MKRGIALALILFLIATFGVSTLEQRIENGETVYVLTEEEFDKTIVKAEQAERLEEELVKALTQLERERRWKRFTLSLTLPLAGAFIGDQINNDYGVYIGLGVGGLASWLISTLSN